MVNIGSRSKPFSVKKGCIIGVKVDSLRTVKVYLRGMANHVHFAKTESAARQYHDKVLELMQ